MLLHEADRDYGADLEVNGNVLRVSFVDLCLAMRRADRQSELARHKYSNRCAQLHSEATGRRDLRQTLAYSIDHAVAEALRVLLAFNKSSCILFSSPTNRRTCQHRRRAATKAASGSSAAHCPRCTRSRWRPKERWRC